MKHAVRFVTTVWRDKSTGRFMQSTYTLQVRALEYMVDFDYDDAGRARPILITRRGLRWPRPHEIRDVITVELQ
jgi:hypothetical protein